MANKEIFRAEIDDSALDDLKRKYDEYSTALQTMPVHWKAASAEITKQKSSFERMYDALEKQKTGLLSSFASQEKFNIALDAAALSWVGMLKTGKLFAGHIIHSTMHLHRWEKLTALFAGILGAGGLFGISRMAMSVASQRTSATGLGISYGEQASFLTNYARLGNAESILSGFSEAEGSKNKYALQQYLGHAPSGDAARDFSEGLKRLKTFVDQYKSSDQKQLLASQLRARHYDELGIIPEVARIIQGMSDAEIEQIQGGYKGDIAGRLGLSDADAKKWTDFTQQMAEAGQDIETTFVKGSINLTGPLTHLSDSFTNFVDKLINNSKVKDFIIKLGNEISDFADNLGSEAMQAKTTQVGKSISDIVRFFDITVNKYPGGIAAVIGITLAAKFGSGAVAVASWLARSGITGPAAAAIVGAAAVYETAKPQPTNEGEDEQYRQLNPGYNPQDPVQRAKHDEWRMKQPGTQGKPGEEWMKGAPKPVPVTPGSEYRRSGGSPATSDAGPTRHQQSEPAAEGTPWNHALAPQASGSPAQAVDLGMSKIGETINDQDIQTYLRTGGHPDPGKQAWCAMFVGASLTKSGIKDSGSGVATSYETWGTAVDPKVGVKRGDVLVVTRGHGPGETGGHVGMLTGRTRSSGSEVEMIAGNAGRGHRVTTSWIHTGGGNVIRRAGERELPVHHAAVNKATDSMSSTPSPRRISDRLPSYMDVLGHHPATVGKFVPQTVIQDNSGGMVSIVQ